MNWTNARYHRELERMESEALRRCQECGTLDELAWDGIAQKFVCEGCHLEIPEDPICPVLYELILPAESVDEVCRVMKEHRQTCEPCYEWAVRRNLESPRKKDPQRESSPAETPGRRAA